MKVTLELLIKKGIDLQTADVLMELIRLEEYHGRELAEKDLDVLIKKFSKTNRI